MNPIVGDKVQIFLRYKDIPEAKGIIVDANETEVKVKIDKSTCTSIIERLYGDSDVIDVEIKYIEIIQEK